MNGNNANIFQNIVENSQPIIFMVDTKGKFLLSEGKSLRALGLKPGEVVGRSAFEMYKDNPAIIEGINNAISGNTTRDTIKVKGAKGDLYFDIFYSPIKEGNNVVSVVGMAIDITEGFEASMQLKEKVKELELTNKMMIGREMEMIKLKQKLGMKPDKSINKE